MNSRHNIETLNAYVDSELSASENAEVANAIALNPELARQVATLSLLKATLASSHCGQQASIELELPGNKKTWLPWAASFAVVFVFGALFATLVMNKNLLLPAEGLQLAEKIHLDWIQQKPASRHNSQQQTVAYDPAQIQIDAYVPDLSGVNLSFSGVRRIASGQSTGMHIGYQGLHGCMVSLVVLNNATGLSAELTHFERDRNLLYGWQVGHTGFYLLAYKMDPARLAEVARVVNRLTRERLPLDPESIITLKQAQFSSKPCLT